MDGYWKFIFPYLSLVVMFGIGIPLFVCCGSTKEEIYIVVLYFSLSVFFFIMYSFAHFRKLPLRIYEKGFIFLTWSKMWGIRKEEDFFIHYDAVGSISFTKIKYKTVDVYTVRVTLMDQTIRKMKYNPSRFEEFPLFIDSICKQNPNIKLEGYDLISIDI